MNKISLHILGWNEWCLEFLRIARPAFAKVMVPQAHNDIMLKRARELSPDTQWICRLYRDEQPLDRPADNAVGHASHLKPYWEYYELFEGYNEIDPRLPGTDQMSPDILRRYNEFEVTLARLVHEKGKKHVAFNWSNGQPGEDGWGYLWDACKETDYIGIHSYGWPFLSDSPFALRHRKISEILRAFAGKPIILTEFGFTNAVIGGPDVGWLTWNIHPLGAREYKCIEELAWFADRLQEDPRVLAACYFTTGRAMGDQWATHDWAPKIYARIAGYNPQTKPIEEAKMENPITVGIRQDYKIWDSPIVDKKTMEMEEYVRYCLPYEMYASWKPEALKVGAIAARTYATWMKTHGKHPGFDVCNSACCQVMGPKVDSRTDRAVKETEGIIITYRDEPIKAMYFSFCDGHTTDGGLPYLKPRLCECREAAPKGTPVAKHNNGLCQWGAQAMALKGATFEEILKHYYGDVALSGKGQQAKIDWEELRKTLQDESMILRARAEIIDSAIRKLNEQIEGTSETP